MQRIALHARLKPGAEDAYGQAHQSVPMELDAALRAAGVHSWRIWRDGLDLFHIVLVEDYQKMRHELHDHPANIPWAARMAELLESTDDYTGVDHGMPLVWELTCSGTGDGVQA
ncbi:hypothetical protein Lfu02_79250 [Longispora fulva]|uniref:L-rhamnose mutarotase n=1 Tax=Longispora fulva TaxID=619741 RepID=A0A8J7G6Z7_9ACTN|nr:L-rhamnose mutarotase [Longispora fulva]MBG6134035.1 L-rhamnose mutarotase [Longispora fulva]GIG63553.1 hypothetical protein Lfu02_79250 [Longispora fulva]